MRTNEEGLQLIKDSEGLRLTAYLDVVGVPTIGYGETLGVTKEDVINKRTITAQEAEDMLRHSLIKYEEGVLACTKVPLNSNQFSALVSFCYNVGIGALEKSTLMKLLNAGEYNSAADQFLRWNKAGGKEYPGLTKRRQNERALFLKAESKKEQLLPEGPSEDEINLKLEDIEKESTSF